MNDAVIIVLLIAAAYLLGAVPVGLVVGRVKGIDIRSVGSGNIGATNVFRFVGKGWGIATFAADALKGFVPAFFFPMLAADPFDVEGLFPVICGCAAIIGHNWPVYLGFKGGKGVATTAGVLLGIAHSAVLIGLLVWAALMVTTRYVSVSSIGAAILIPVIGWILYMEDGLLLPIVLTLFGILIVIRHHSNIARLINGSENRFEFSGKHQGTRRDKRNGLT